MGADQARVMMERWRRVAGGEADPDRARVALDRSMAWRRYLATIEFQRIARDGMTRAERESVFGKGAVR